MNDTGKKIKIRRIELDITQRQLSLMTGIPEVKLSHIECDRRKPFDYEKDLIAKALGTEPSEIWS